MMNSIRVIVFTCLVVFSAGYSQQTFVQQHGQLRVVGAHIVDKNGTPVTLRGMASYHSDAAGKYYTDAVVKWLRDDWFCTVVRAANMTGNYTAEMPKTMALVDAAINNGVYAIIDWHVVGNSNQTNALAFFDVMAKKYANIPNIFYETWNEPVDGTWTTNLKPYHEAVIAKIRQYDSANIIICGTRYWSKYVDEASLNPITKYKNIAYTLHWYSFQDFQDLRNRTTTAMKNGICVFSTENGVANFNQSPCKSDGSGLNFAEGQTWFKFCNDSGISTATWSVHDKDECTSILKPGTDPSGQGNWAISSLTTSGVWMRNYLRQMNAAIVADPKSPGEKIFTILSRDNRKSKLFDLRGRLLGNKGQASVIKKANGIILEQSSGNTLNKIRNSLTLSAFVLIPLYDGNAKKEYSASDQGEEQHHRLYEVFHMPHACIIMCQLPFLSNANYR